MRVRDQRGIIVSALIGCIAVPAAAAGDPAPAKPKHKLSRSASGNVVVGLCDGETSVEVKGVKPGQAMTRTQAQSVADELMTEWRRKNPNARWDPPPSMGGQLLAQQTAPPKGTPEQSPRSPRDLPPSAPPPAGSSVRKAGESAQSAAREVPAQQSQNAQSAHTYGAFGPRDEAIWRASLQQFVDEGKRVFHDAKALGGTVAMSCDMCHPDGANTHPETYPKFQVQLGRVAMLRDMINWCIENPVRGKPLADDDPKLKAIEAYIYAQRKGTPLDFGKH